jgi:hypothetical protein
VAGGRHPRNDFRQQRSSPRGTHRGADHAVMSERHVFAARDSMGTALSIACRENGVALVRTLEHPQALAELLVQAAHRCGRTCGFSECRARRESRRRAANRVHSRSTAARSRRLPRPGARRVRALARHAVSGGDSSIGLRGLSRARGPPPRHAKRCRVFAGFDAVASAGVGAEAHY